jgi:diguanylate cyclase (GGDEF)-like protein
MMHQIYLMSGSGPAPVWLGNGLERPVTKANLRNRLDSLPAVVLRGTGPLAKLMRDQELYPVFQPITDLRDGQIHAHEALIRGPKNTAMHAPDALLAAAQQEGLLHEFELFCAVAAIRCWGQLNQPGRLFVNISADALVKVVQLCGVHDLSEYVRGMGVSPRMLVMEITEHERVNDMGILAKVVQEVHSVGASLALDDFGDGRSSLRLWSQIKPDIVKIDKYFTKDISGHADNLKTIQALMQIAEIFGTSLVAEGVENEEDLRVLRDIGITYGQGYLIGRPAVEVLDAIQPAALQVLKDPRVSVMPELRHVSRTGRLRNLSLVHAPCVSLSTSNNDVAALFMASPELHALAVLSNDRPVAIINRQQFMDQFATLYFREVYGKKVCAQLANHAPRLIERDHDIDELVGILTSQDQRYLTDGFIVTENGRYVGLGTGDQLVRSVTEVRLEAARHANPLTFLPGNIPISLHIKRLLENGVPFVACYADLNHFKPFNDHYGYWRGDEMIRLVAKMAVNYSDSQRDFVGHVGGDDFLILFQSDDWKERCTLMLDEFTSRAIALYDEPAREKGGITAEDRHGITRFFPFTTLSIGATYIGSRQFEDAEDVANLAAMAKRDAKLAGAGLFIREVPSIALN